MEIDITDTYQSKNIYKKQLTLSEFFKKIMNQDQEPESQFDDATDSVAMTVVIKLVMDIILAREMKAFSDDLKYQMVKYRNNLLQKILEKLPEVDQTPLCMGKFLGSFSAGWEEWRKNGEDKEESSFHIFTTKMEV